MRHSRRISKFILIGCILAMVSLAIYSSDKGPGLGIASYVTEDFAEEETAKLEITSNKVEVQLAGSTEWIPAANNQELQEGARVRTNTTGTAQIVYPSGSMTSIDVNSEVLLEEFDLQPQNITVHLTQGRVWSTVIKLFGGESYETKSVNMVAAVRGTSYVHSIGKDGKDEIITTEHVVDVGCIRGVKKHINVTQDNMVSSDCKANATELKAVKATIQKLNDGWLKDKLQKEPKRREEVLKVIEEKRKQREEAKKKVKEAQEKAKNSGGLLQSLFSQNSQTQENESSDEGLVVKNKKTPPGQAKKNNTEVEGVSGEATPTPSPEATVEPTVEPTSEPTPTPEATPSV